uniref:Uncharacterized protein n=1 Tax=Oryza sativa subsp. japonica TaxID=39947 RepID=Q7XI28_ORYSJ|nr:hypothetical protein [Oryza sativa Japonica Group]BAD30187.1 hypothetical protein [Oryza sativa Japonica Group]
MSGPRPNSHEVPSHAAPLHRCRPQEHVVVVVFGSRGLLSLFCSVNFLLVN